jgi:hypothetical protein
MPTFTIDGDRYEPLWGEQFPSAGTEPHQLQVSYRYLPLYRAGKAASLVDVAPNEVVPASEAGFLRSAGMRSYLPEFSAHPLRESGCVFRSWIGVPMRNLPFAVLPAEDRGHA